MTDLPKLLLKDWLPTHCPICSKLIEVNQSNRYESIFCPRNYDYHFGTSYSWDAEEFWVKFEDFTYYEDEDHSYITLNRKIIWKNDKWNYLYQISFQEILNIFMKLKENSLFL